MTSMTLIRFKQKLAMHGADLRRWDGHDEAELRAFIAANDKAAALYEETQALDAALGSFEVPAADPAILGRVMARIGAPERAEQEQAAQIHHLRPDVDIEPAASLRGKPKTRQPLFTPPVLWGGAGAAALAAAVMLFIGVSGPMTATVTVSPVAETAAVSAPAPSVAALAAEAESLLALVAEEEIIQYEMLALLDEQVQLSAESEAEEQQPANADDIDTFLDELFDSREPDEALQQELDLWELFLESENTREL